jgi:hypothetical protein
VKEAGMFEAGTIEADVKKQDLCAKISRNARDLD